MNSDGHTHACTYAGGLPRQEIYFLSSLKTDLTHVIGKELLLRYTGKTAAAALLILRFLHFDT